MAEHIVTAFSWIIAIALVVRWLNMTRTIRRDPTQRTMRVYEDRIEID